MLAIIIYLILVYNLPGISHVGKTNKVFHVGNKYPGISCWLNI